MSKRRIGFFFYFTVFAILAVETPSPARADAGAPALTGRTMRFPDAPHPGALVEWWYANAHVTTKRGRHLAIVTAFFKFGSPSAAASMGMPSMPPSHYLIYAVTDLDRKTQRSYSYADTAMASGLKNLLLLTGAQDPRSMSILRALLHDRLPAPHRMITGPIGIASNPFSMKYGTAGSMAAIPDHLDAYRLTLGTGDDRVDFDLASTKPVMPVGGNGETGIVKPDDMYYYSLTRCDVTGDIGGDSVASGQGWIDHQWGSSWTTRSSGWDWWGIQLDGGTDILMFQQRNLATGKTFFPLATILDGEGNLTVVRRIKFVPVPGAVWKSPRSGYVYPTAWDISFPDLYFDMRITADIDSQEIPILSPGGDIWEGSCQVFASGRRPFGRIDPPIPGMRLGYSTHGVAYMELVGYDRSPAGHTQLKRPR